MHDDEKEIPDFVTMSFFSILALIISCVALYRTGTIDRQVADAVREAQNLQSATIANHAAWIRHLEEVCKK